MDHKNVEIEGFKFTKILVAIDEDDSSSSARAYSYAVNLAKQSGAGLGIVSILESRDINIYESLTPDLIKQKRYSLEDAVEDYIERAEDFGVKEVKGFVDEGIPSKVIVSRIVPDYGCDLLVCGFKTKKTITEELLLGSHASYMVREAPCSVIVIK